MSGSVVGSCTKAAATKKGSRFNGVLHQKHEKVLGVGLGRDGGIVCCRLVKFWPWRLGIDLFLPCSFYRRVVACAARQMMLIERESTPQMCIEPLRCWYGAAERGLRSLEEQCEFGGNAELFSLPYSF